MSHAQAKHERRGSTDAPAHWVPELLTRIALLIALAVVVARVTYADAGRFRDEPISGDVMRGATPAGSIGMDLLACVPALLVLARRVSDRQYVLRWSWAVLPMLLLAGWSALSITWAADKFRALLGASHWVAATALLWAGVQLVRSWRRLRLVASIGAGLLLAMFASALMYQMVDVPDLRDFWTKHACPDHADIRQDHPGTCPRDGKALVTGRQTLMASKGWTENDFLFRQFEKKVLSGEAQGVFTSANTFAAVVSLLMLVALGLGLQRFVSDRTDQASFAVLLLVPLGAWILYLTSSRTAMGTAVLGLVLLIAALRWRERLAAHSKAFFWWGVGLLLLGAVAVIGHGLKHNSLFHTSMTFRWHYWVGGMRTFASHPILGVGPENFGLHYLAHRLPEAPEEVKDPHNLLVKFLVELGLVGGLLAFAWLGRMAWELTRPVTPPAPETTGPAQGVPRKAIGSIALICLAALTLNIINSIDFSQFGVADRVWAVFLDLLRRVIVLAMLIIGTTVAAIRSLKDPQLDDRPAPVLLAAMLCGLGMFLLHNMVDFSMSEAGPLVLFALLAGCALGVRQPSVAGKTKRTAAAAVALGVGAVLWLLVAGFVWAPTVLAEDQAAAADTAMRTGRPFESARLYSRAFEHQPLESAYLYRAAWVRTARGVYDPDVVPLLSHAIRVNPMAPEYHLLRARFCQRHADAGADPKTIAADFEKAVALDPNSIDLRVEYGDALAAIKTPESRAAALQQYQLALTLNGLLKPDEPKKRQGKDLSAIVERVERLKQ